MYVCVAACVLPGVRKTTFPKVTDTGLAAATSTFSAEVSFDVVTDADRNIAVSNVAAHVSIDTLPGLRPPAPAAAAGLLSLPASAPLTQTLSFNPC